MPPKRTSKSSSAASSRRKRPRQDSASDTEPSIPRNARWSAVSGSANIDGAYKYATKDPAHAYSYICMCPPPFERHDDDDDDDDEWEDVSSGEEEHASGNEKEDIGKDKQKHRCDGGSSCLCKKPAADHPGHPWIITVAGFQKYFAQHVQISLRDPDNFEMYTFNDHAGYGVLEVVQNLFLDFVEAESNWKEQWAVCEGTVLILLHDAVSPFQMIDDADTFFATNRLIGHMFLAMLATLERHDLLKPDSEVKNLGVIMALYLKLASDWRSDDSLGELAELADEMPKKSKKTFVFDRTHFDDYVLAYAKKYNIRLLGPSDINDLIEDLEEDPEEISLPPTSDDPWGWGSAFKSYVKDYSTSVRGPSGRIGGDAYDITTWSSAERKRHSFTDKDPLSKKEIDALKKGMVLQLC